MTRKRAAPPAATQSRIAYHDGPPEILFAGRRWVRGIAQPVGAEELEAMKKRRDFAAYRFTTAG